MQTQGYAHQAAWLLAILGCLVYTGSRIVQESNQSFLSTRISSPPAPILVQKIVTGPFLGMAADYNILSVFTLYDQIQHTVDPPQRLERKESAWQQLSMHLDHSSDLDPWFMDTYRLTTGLLAYSGFGTQDAINILKKGSMARTWDWEIPFLAGFISYDALNDHEQALELFKLATQRPNAPSMAIGLASKILTQDKGVEASISFLQYLLQTMPKQYHDGIQQRMKVLQGLQPASEAKH